MPDAETKAAPRAETRRAQAPQAGAFPGVLWTVVCALGILAGLAGIVFGAVALGADIPAGGEVFPKVALLALGVITLVLAINNFLLSWKMSSVAAMMSDKLRWLAEYEARLRRIAESAEKESD